MSVKLSRTQQCYTLSNFHCRRNELNPLVTWKMLVKQKNSKLENSIVGRHFCHVSATPAAHYDARCLPAKAASGQMQSCELMNISTNRPAKEWTDQRKNEHTNERMNRPMKEWTDQRKNEQTSERMNTPTKELTDQWKNEQTNERMNRPMKEWTDQRKNEQTNERMNTPTKEPTNDNQPTN